MPSIFPVLRSFAREVGAKLPVDNRSQRTRNLVVRADGKTVNVVRKQGHLFVCATGCCCGHTERNFPSVPTELYHNEWERRKLRNRVHLTIGGCLGPCTLYNVCMLLFDSRALWFHSLNSEGLVRDLYDYIESMLAAGAYLPPPPSLIDHVFTSFTWDETQQAHRPELQLPQREEAGAILVLTQADTDLLLSRQVRSLLPPDFPEVRTFNPSHLRTEEDIEIFLNRHLPYADIIILRLIGGRASFPYGFDRIVEWARKTDTWLVCLPGTDALDPELTAVSTTGVPVAHEAYAYLQFGGATNYANCLRFLTDHLLATGYGFDPPQELPRTGYYYPGLSNPTLAELHAQHNPVWPTVGILFYRSHLLAGNTQFIDTLVEACRARNLNALPVYTYSLKDATDLQCSTPLPPSLPDAFKLFYQGHRSLIDVVISTMSFSISTGATSESNSIAQDALTTLGVPILQAITASTTRSQWEASTRGLSPLDTAMNVAIPEFDGRIITVPISFKEHLSPTPQSNDGAAIVHYAPEQERAERVVALAYRFAQLRRKSNADKRIAVILTNSTAKASRIGNAVGLDAPASLIRLFHAMRQHGYTIGDIPSSGDELIHQLIARCSYDQELLTDWQLDHAAARIPTPQYLTWHQSLPRSNQSEMDHRWGIPPGLAYVHNDHIALAGLELGNVFIALQPPRGYGMDPNLIYHQPDLPPPHYYYALYRWLCDPQGWNADAIIHLGKHGTLEWLPGKSLGLSPTCYPDAFLSDLPLIYPFIINDPGEGTQAKRRTHAIIIDHMTPPLTTAGAYGELAELAQLVDEYYQVEQLDPSKLPLLQQQIWQLLQQAHLDDDLKTMMTVSHDGHTHAWDDAFTEDGTPVAIAELRGKDFAHLLEDIDGYLCELTGLQIRDGLHILGHVSSGEELVELLFCLVRLPNLDIPSLPVAVAAALGYDLTALLEAPGARLTQSSLNTSFVAVTNADLVEHIHHLCRALLRNLLHRLGDSHIQPSANIPVPLSVLQSTAVTTVLHFVETTILPRLQQNTQEITHLLAALEGHFVLPGPSGAPTRGMAHVLPTGRNFYAIDPRTLPTIAAWNTGQQLARELLTRYLRETHAYPQQIGITIWGTSAMRTQGDDIAEVFALLGVRPCWQRENRRILGIEPIPLAELGHPRIDVVCRISGFFRDAFPHLIVLLDEAFQLVSQLDEPLEQNYLRRRVLSDKQRLIQNGLSPDVAHRRASYRIFGSKPGSYGAGILPLIDEKNWQNLADFATAYVNWGGYAYTATDMGVDARQEFREHLTTISIAVKNQDNREHDIFDSDDYLQFHGGMIATARALSGKMPRRFFGDSSDPARPRVRDLREETTRIFRARVINPKWITAMQRHGYKGALELAATVDYLFGYDATSDVVPDWMYDRLSQEYALNPQLQAFFKQSNPWALKDITERLLEAIHRGLWANPSQERQAQLEQLFLDLDGELEAQ